VAHAERAPGLPAGQGVLVGAGAAAAALLTVAVAPAPPLALVALALGTSVLVAVVVHPPVAAYLLLALTPLTAGIERGVVMPLLRPNEALLALVAAGLAARGLLALIQGAGGRLRLHAVDWSVLALAWTGSVLPLLWMVARGREVTADDLLYGSYIWKYAALYTVVRLSVRTEPQVRTCLWVSLASGAVVALVAVLQSLGVSPVTTALTTWYAGGEADASPAAAP
jgi:hypothetical protein